MSARYREAGGDPTLARPERARCPPRSRQSIVLRRREGRLAPCPSQARIKRKEKTGGRITPGNEKRASARLAKTLLMPWWSARDLNPRPCACKAPALPLRHATEHITRLNARVRIVPQVPRRSKWKAGRRDDSASRAPRGTAPTAQRAARSRHGAHGATSAQRPRHCRRRRRWSRASGPPRAP